MTTLHSRLATLAAFAVLAVGCHGAAGQPGSRAGAASGPLVDRHRYLTVLGHKAAYAQKVLGKGKLSDDGESWSYISYNVKPFDWFAVRTRWAHSASAEWRRHPEEVAIRVQVKPMPFDALFRALGLSLPQWKQQPHDPRDTQGLSHEFKAGPYSISIEMPYSGIKDMDIYLTRG